MKIYKILMVAIIAVFTFIFGTSIVYAWKLVANEIAASKTITEELADPVTSYPEVAVGAVEYIPAADVETEATATGNTEETEDRPAEEVFDADGNYYPIDEKLPKSFAKLDYLWITTREWDGNVDEYPNGKPIPPKGEIKIGKTFKFTRVYVGGREIAFTTETIGGVSYRFVGIFPKQDYCDLSGEESVPSLTGRLIRIKNGKWDAEGNIDLYEEGCGC